MKRRVWVLSLLVVVLAAAPATGAAAGEGLLPPATLKRIFRQGHPGARILGLRSSALLIGPYEGVLFRPAPGKGPSYVDLAVYRGRRPVAKPGAEVVHDLSPEPLWKLSITAKMAWTTTRTELHPAETSLGFESVEEAIPAWSRSETTSGSLSWSWTGATEPWDLAASDGAGLRGELQASGSATTQASQTDNPAKSATCVNPLRLRDGDNGGEYGPVGKLTAHGRRERFVIDDFFIEHTIRGEERDDCVARGATGPGVPGEPHAFMYVDIDVPQAPWVSPTTVPIDFSYDHPRDSAELHFDETLRIKGTATMRLIGFR